MQLTKMYVFTFTFAFTFTNTTSYLFYLFSVSVSAVVMNHDEVPWVDEAQSPVEWIFDKPRPDLSARLIQNLSKAAIVTNSDDTANGNNKRSSSGKATPAAKRQRTGNGTSSSGNCFDSLKLVSSADATTAFVSGTSRPMTFIEMLLQSAAVVLNIVDKEFSNAASSNLIHGLNYISTISVWHMWSVVDGFQFGISQTFVDIDSGT